MFRDETNLLNNAYFNSGWKYAQTGSFANRYYQDGYNGGHQWLIAPSGTAGNVISFTQAMTLNASGFLGIGETNPTSRLHIQSSASGGQNIRVVTSVAAGRNYMQFANGSGDMGYIGYGGADSKFYINNQLADDMLFVNNGATRLTIASTGAATFSSSVTAGGDVNIPNGNYYYAKRSTGGANIGVLGFASGSDTLTIKGGSSGGTNSINFEDTGGIIASFFNGRLGIGTTAPAYKLSVIGNTYTEGIYVATGQFSQGGSATSTFYTFSNVSANRVFMITLRQSGSGPNTVTGMCYIYGTNSTAYNIGQDNTNPALYLTLTTSGLDLRLTTAAGYGTTTWDWTITQIK
jgi:hypothetical protein